MSSKMKSLDPSPSIRQRIQDAVRDYVVENGLQPGDALPPETKLADQLGVSRPSVREAVKIMESTGFVRSERGRGLFVGEFSFDPLLDHMPFGLMHDLDKLVELLQIRKFLELGMTDGVLAEIDHAQIDALRSLLVQMEAEAERGGISPESDFTFHQLFCGNLRNPIITKVSDMFWQAFRRASQHSDIVDYDPMRTYRDHAAVLEAMVSGEPERVRIAVEQHYSFIGERLARAKELS